MYTRPTILDDLSPTDLGLPAKFTEFRQIQREMTDFALYGPDQDSEQRRFIGCGAPGGSGKSLVSQVIGRSAGMKFATLTATLALEDQYVKDQFAGLVNIRGRANYDCADILNPLHPEEKHSCEDGYDGDCFYCDTVRCTYTGRVEQAKSSRAVLSNYAYWLHARSHNRLALERKGGSDPIRLLIVDEAHRAFGSLANFLGVWFSNDTLHQYARETYRETLAYTRGRDWGRVELPWLNLLTAVWGGVATRMVEIASHFKTEAEAARKSKEYRKLDRLAGNLDRIVTHADDGNWLWRLTNRGVSFDCVWPSRYAERYLWSGVEKVVLMSATLRPKALQLLGIKPKDYWFKEWASPFPAQNLNVVWVPTGRMGKNSADWGAAVERANEIYAEWGHLKGIVHTPSYQLAEKLQADTKYGRNMILSKPGETQKAEDEFRTSTTKNILVSPSFAEGFDFVGAACDWEHIPKLPFPNKSDPIVETRMEMDREWYDYETMQKFEQACYRGRRHETDKCTVIVTDDAVRNFRRYAGQFATKSFRVKDATEVPKAPR